MDIVKSFITNHVLYMTITLPLKHNKVPIMSIYSLHTYCMPTNMSDKNHKDNIDMNTNEIEMNDNILEIDSWFDVEIQSTMIFMFISGIVELVGYVLIIFLCHKHEKFRKVLSFILITSGPVVGTNTIPTIHDVINIYIYMPIDYNMYIVITISDIQIGDIMVQILLQIPHQTALSQNAWYSERSINICCN